MNLKENQHKSGVISTLGSVKLIIMLPQNVRMTVVMMTMMILVTSLTVLDMNVEERKTTDAVQYAASGKCPPPAEHMAMAKGKCQMLNCKVTLNMSKPPPKELPNWLRDFGSSLSDDITGRIEGKFRKEILELTENTSSEISKISSAVEEVQTSNEATNKKLDETNKKVDQLFDEMDRVRKLKSEVVVPESTNQSKDKLELYDQMFHDSENTVGLFPFHPLDLNRVMDWLIKKDLESDNPTNRRPTKAEILTASMYDYLGDEMGMDETAIDALSSKVLDMFLQKVPFKNSDPKNLTLFIRSKDTALRKSCFLHARQMNKSQKKFNKEPHRIVLHIIPQLQKRHSALIVAGKMFQEDCWHNKRVGMHTRVEYENGNIVLQVREDGEKYHHTVNITEYYPDFKLPGIAYNKTTYDDNKKPEIYKFAGNTTPPGRMRQNGSIRHPENNPPRDQPTNDPRIKLSIGNGNLKPSGNPPKRDLREEETNQRLIDMANGNSSLVTAGPSGGARADARNTVEIFKSNSLVDLDDVLNEQAGNLVINTVHVVQANSSPPEETRTVYEVLDDDNDMEMYDPSKDPSPIVPLANWKPDVDRKFHKLRDMETKKTEALSTAKSALAKFDSYSMTDLSDKDKDRLTPELASKIKNSFIKYVVATEGPTRVKLAIKEAAAEKRERQKKEKAEKEKRKSLKKVTTKAASADSVTKRSSQTHSVRRTASRAANADKNRAELAENRKKNGEGDDDDEEYETEVDCSILDEPESEKDEGKE